MGEFSILTIKLLFLFLPGIVFRLLYEHWNFYLNKEFNMFIIYSFLGGVYSYSVYYGIIKLFKIHQDVFFIGDILNCQSGSIHYSEILWACLISILTVYCISHWKTHHINKKIFKKSTYTEPVGFLDLFRKLKPTNIEHSLGVWDCIFDNLDENNSAWIKIHYPKRNRIYYGYLDKYSETVKDNELYITDVNIQDINGQEIKHVDGLYICQKTEDVIIEIIKNNSNNETKEVKNERTKQSKRKTKSKK